MNDEIKEILDNLKNEDNDIKGINFLKYQYLIRGEINLLLDYITNLQQEIEKLNDDKRGMLVQLYKANDEKDKIKQENQTLQENNQNMQEEMARTWQKCDNLQQENDNLTNLVKEFENKGYDIGQERADFLLEIKDLQQENERLKQNQVKALNRIRDFINSSKCEITEGSYSNDKHSQYWLMFKRFAEELQDKIKGIDTKDYVYIPKWREQELLNQEEQLEDYKSRCEKANNQLKIIMQILKEQPNRSIKDDEWLENRLIAVANILQNGSEKDE